MTRIARFLAVLALIVAPVAAQSQSTPNLIPGGNVFGRTAPQWTTYFGSKADAVGGTLDNPTINNAVINNATFPGGPIGPTYVVVVPLDGETLTTPPGVGAIRAVPAGALATLTLVLPPAPQDRTTLEFSTTQSITTLAATAPGFTILGPTSYGLAAGDGVSWQWVGTAWVPRYK